MISPRAAFDAGRLERLGIEPAWSRSIGVTVAGGRRVQVHALDATPSDGLQPPLTVVCVHGNPTWSLLWRSFHRRLGDRYRVGESRDWLVGAAEDEIEEVLHLEFVRRP